jgi:hypothetical protein
MHMNWDRIQGNWRHVAGKARERWGKLTDNVKIRKRHAVASGGADGHPPGEVIAGASLFADTEAGWWSP